MKNNEDQRIRQAFVERLNQAMDAAGWPSKHHGRQVRMAKEFGLTPAAINRWMSGQRLPRRDTYEHIARVLEVRLEWLFFGLGHMKETEFVTPHQQPDAELLKIILSVIRNVHRRYPLSDVQQDELATEMYDALRSDTRFAKGIKTV